MASLNCQVEAGDQSNAQKRIAVARRNLVKLTIFSEFYNLTHKRLMKGIVEKCSYIVLLPEVCVLFILM